LICAFLFAHLLSNGQNKYADSLFGIGQYQKAVIEYEFTCFSTVSDSISLKSRYQKIQCFKQLGMFAKAIQEANKMDTLKISESEKQTLFHELALCYFMEGHFEQAVFFGEKSLFLNYNKDIHLLLILSNLEKLNFERSEFELTNFIEHNLQANKQHAYKDSVKLLFNNKNIPKLKSTNTARKLSRIIPGSGQIYSGNVTEGLFNLLLHSGILAFGIYEAIVGYYVSAYFSGIGILSKFYGGGIRRAIYLTKKENERRTELFENKAKNLITQIYLNSLYTH